MYKEEDEFYIIHFHSGTIINWYKHLGRTNTCNKEGFSTDDLIEFLVLLKMTCQNPFKNKRWKENNRKKSEGVICVR